MNTGKPTAKSKTSVPTVILNGFLGSGKTTLLKSLLNQSAKKGLSVCVIVNDMSELDVDGELVADMEITKQSNCYFESIYSCILSSRTGLDKLEQALQKILSGSKPDLILIETSGSCHPMPLVEFFNLTQDFDLTGVLTLVDSSLLAQDFNYGKDILPQLQSNLKSNLRSTVNLLVEQIMFCSHLMLTKSDRLEDGDLQRIAGFAHQLNPYVNILSVPWGKLAIDDVLTMPNYDFYKVEKLIEELRPVIESEAYDERPYDLATRIIKDDRPFHPDRLWAVCNKHLGDKVYRSKGFFWFPTRDKFSLLWNQAAGGINLEFVGFWRSGILEDSENGLSKMEIELLEKRLEKESGQFGDRCCHLTIIGDKTQVDTFEEALKHCFLTSDEIKYWQNGGEFNDPWPTQIVKVN